MCGAFGGSRAAVPPSRVDACVGSYLVLPDAKDAVFGSGAAHHSGENRGQGGNDLKLTRHNERSGRHGVYNPRHNDRRFDLGNSEHIDTDLASIGYFRRWLWEIRIFCFVTYW